MRVPDGGCFCLFASPLVGLIYVSVLEGHSRRGAPLPFVLFSTSKVPVRNMQVPIEEGTESGKKSAIKKSSFLDPCPPFFYFLIILLKLKELICEIFSF